MTTLSLIQKKMHDLHYTMLRKDINRSCSIILESVISEVKDGCRCEFRHFGSFFLKTFKFKIGRNPRTGAAIILREGRKTIRFRASKTLLKRLNKS